MTLLIHNEPALLQAAAGTSVTLSFPAQLAPDLIAVRRGAIRWKQSEKRQPILVRFVIVLSHITSLCSPPCQQLWILPGFLRGHGIPVDLQGRCPGISSVGLTGRDRTPKTDQPSRLGHGVDQDRSQQSGTGHAESGYPDSVVGLMSGNRLIGASVAELEAEIDDGRFQLLDLLPGSFQLGNILAGTSLIRRSPDLRQGRQRRLIGFGQGVKIAFRSRYLRVAKSFLDDLEVGPAVQQPRGVCVAETVKGETFDLSFLQSGLEDAGTEGAVFQVRVQFADLATGLRRPVVAVLAALPPVGSDA